MSSTYNSAVGSLQRSYSSPPTTSAESDIKSNNYDLHGDSDTKSNDSDLHLKKARTQQQLQSVLSTDDDDQDNDEITPPFGWLIYFFAFFFPTMLKKYVWTWTQALVGFISITASIVFFCYLFFSFYNKCDTQTVETSIRDPKASCVERYMTHDITYAIDIKGQWENEFDSNANAFGGPWRVSLKAYQANESVFNANMNEILSAARNITSELQYRSFFDIVEGVYFFKYVVNGTQGSATLAAQISIESIFQNYQISGFAIVDLASQLKNNWEKNRNPLLQDQDFDLPGGKSFCCSCILVESYSSACKIRFDSTSTKDGLHVITPNLTTKELFRHYSLPHIDERKHPNTRVPLEDFKLEYDLTEVFILDYCNKAGKSYCKSLFSNFDFEKGNLTFHKVPRFWGTFNKATSVDYNFLLRDFQVAYIHTLQQFALILQPYRTEDSNPSYLLVPQIHSFEAQRDDGEQVGNACGNCPLNSSSYDEVLRLQRGCQRQVYIYLHLYVMAHQAQEYQTFGNNTVEAYTFSFVYWLTSEDEFYYDDFYSQVDHLHCNSSEWAFDEAVKVSHPVTLTTGIYSCVKPVCMPILEKLANAEANVGLLYLGFLLVTLALFLCIYFPKKAYERQNREAIKTLALVISEIQQ